jgi:hypothetical protein
VIYIYAGLSSIILGTALIIIQSGQKVADAYASIEELLGQFGNFLGRLEEYTKPTGKIDSKMKKHITDILTTYATITPFDI